MAVMTPPSTQQEMDWPIRRLWTIEEFEEAGELGLFDPDERLELLYGEVYKKLSPQLTPHATAVELAAETMRATFHGKVHVRNQNPFNIGQRSQPEPDVYVARGEIRDYAKAHPRTAEIVIEIADTTLRMDLGKKAALYASAGVPDYWVVDLKNRQLVVHREPEEDLESPSGFRYRSVSRHAESEFVKPLRADAEVKVADLLP